MRLVLSLICFAAAVVAQPNFVNEAAERGLTDTIPQGDGKKLWIVESTGGGAALIDVDNDHDLDAFLVSGPGSSHRLYLNGGRGRFRDASKAFGLTETREGWGQGVCAGDYDNDGWTDLFVTYWGQNSLLHNDRGNRFVERAHSAGLDQDRKRYNTGCAFLDYDRDGDLDLFVANYLRFDFETTPKPGDNPYCYYRNVPVLCGPRGLPFDSNILYRNDGDGTFTDVSKASGIADARRHYALGVVVTDIDNDGWPDIYVACDRTASLLFWNQGDGTFAEEAMFRGAALDENGMALSGMGAAAADYDRDGWIDLFRTNFSDERATLYRNRSDGEFDEATAAAGMAHNTRFVGWGAAWLDADNDARLDLIQVNGHVFPEVDELEGDLRYRERSIFYWQRENGKFADYSAKAGPGIGERNTARGAAVGDVDCDGLVDVLINNQDAPPALLMNQSRYAGHWIQVRLEGTDANRSAIGARVSIGDQMREVRGGTGYLSQNPLTVHFGLSTATEVDIRVLWPDGEEQSCAAMAVDRLVRITQNESAIADLGACGAGPIRR